MANPLLNFGNTLTNITQSGLDRAQNIFMNQAPNRLLDYTTNVGITGVPFAGDINIPLEGRTKPVTNLSEIAPTKSTRNVLMEGIASNMNRKNLNFDKSFSSVIQSKGGGGEYALDRPIDYSGYKLGNPLPGAKNLAKEVGQVWNTMLGSAPNQIANILGDYTTRYTPKLDPNHPEVMSIYDRYDFVGKAGEGRGSPYDININLPPEMIKQIKQMSSNKRAQRFKQQQLMNRRKQNMQQQIRQAEAIEAARQKVTTAKGPPSITQTGGGGVSNINIQKRKIGMPEHLTRIPPKKTYVSPARPHGGEGGGGQRGSNRGGFSDPGKGSYGPWKADGGLIDFYRHGGFIG